MGYPFLDTLQNLVAGLMARGDKAQSDRYYFAELTKEQLETAYRTDWIARKCVDIPPYDSCRAWRDWQAEDSDITSLDAEEKRLAMRAKVMRAATMARLYGGAAIYMGVDQGAPSEELKPDQVKKGSLKYLHVFNRYQLVTGMLELDPLSPFWGQPKTYALHSPAGSVEIHPSRMVPFLGNPVPDPNLSLQGWGDPIIQVLDDAIKAAALTSQSIASLVHEAKVDVVHIPDLADHLLTTESTARLTSRFAMASALKSNNAMLLLDALETWERKEVTFGGLHDILSQYLQIASGAADIPATRFIGQVPRGLNATGEADIRNYYDMISSRQEIDLRPLMERIDAVLVPSTFGTSNPDIWFEYAPLWQMTETEKATVGKTKAETTQIYANSALIPPDALATGVQNQLVEDGIFPGLEVALAASQLALTVPPIDPNAVTPTQGQDPNAVTPQQVQQVAKDAAKKARGKRGKRVVAELKDKEPQQNAE